jgi:hypothetical protein
MMPKEHSIPVFFINRSSRRKTRFSYRLPDRDNLFAQKIKENCSGCCDG